MLTELVCLNCKEPVVPKGHFFVHEDDGVLCFKCFHALPEEKQKEVDKIREFCKHFRSGWMQLRYRYIDINNKPGWMLPVPRDTKVFIPLKEVQE